MITSPVLRDIPVAVETPPAEIRESGREESEGGDNDASPGRSCLRSPDPVRQAGFWHWPFATHGAHPPL